MIYLYFFLYSSTNPLNKIKFIYFFKWNAFHDNFSLTLLLNFFCGNKWNHWVGFFPLVYFMCPIAKSLKFDAEPSIVELHSNFLSPLVILFKNLNWALRLLIYKSNLLHVIVCFNLSYTHFVSDKTFRKF